MNGKKMSDWDPGLKDVQQDQIKAYDEMRDRCPVAYSELLQWSVFRYEDVISIINEEEKFSNAVSQHLSIPGGMDPPEHTRYRQIIDKYFTPERMNAFEHVCREIVVDLVNHAVMKDEVGINE